MKNELFDDEEYTSPNLDPEAMRRVEALRHTHHREYRKETERVSLLERDIGINRYGEVENVSRPQPPEYEDDTPLTEIFPTDT